jgi:hypothetical protein
MSIVRKSFVPAVGVLALTLAISILSPGTVRAVTAALVQIVNTPANAVATVHAPAGSQIDAKGCGASSPYTEENLECSSLTIETGKTFVVQTLTVAVSVQHGVVPLGASLEAPYGWPLAYVPLVQQGSKNGIDHYVGTLSGASIYLTAGSTARCSAALSGPGTAGYHHFYCMVQGYKVPSQ